MKNNSIIIIGFVIILLFLSLFFFYNKSKQHIQAKNFIDKIRKDNKASFDSIQHALNYESELNYRIKLSIQNHDFTTAYSLMDSLPSFGKENIITIYEGMIYEKKKEYLKAISKYTIAINYDKHSIAVENRAQLFIKMNRFQDAINDYKIPLEWNNYYNLKIAQVFELMGKKDSAVKYYIIYSRHYPNDTIASKKIIILTK